jgi:hypothetical protein
MPNFLKEERIALAVLVLGCFCPATGDGHLATWVAGGVRAAVRCFRVSASLLRGRPLRRAGPASSGLTVPRSSGLPLSVSPCLRVPASSLSAPRLLLLLPAAGVC